MFELMYLWGCCMEKFLQLVLNRLGIVLLSSIIFLSIPQQEFSIKYSIPVACSETVAATYPKLNYSTYFGGYSGPESGFGIAVFVSGSYYVTGQTGSSDFPTQHAYNNTLSGSRDAIIAKFNDNNSLLWSTYFGGSDTDLSRDIAVASDGSCYVTGETQSSDFPTKNAFDSTFNGGYDDVFVAKFAANGSLLWSTLLGGGGNFDIGCSIAVASDGSCYVTGETTSSDFPTMNAYASTFNGGNFDAFVTKFAANGTLLWSTFLGGNGNDVGYGLAVSNDGSCYVTGFTGSSDFPTQNAFDTTPNGDWDVFITKFNANGSLLWSTYFGGISWDEGLGIATASDGSCYITGFTASINFPTQYAYNSTCGNWGDAFLAKFAINGSLLWSTFLGGNGPDRGYDVAVTSDGSCFVTGETGSDDFPIQHAYSSSKNSGFDAFVTKFSSDGSFLWGTYLGGSRTDQGYGIAASENDSCYVIGQTYSTFFPTLNAYDYFLGGSSGIFISIFVDSPLPSTPSTNSHSVDGFLLFIVAMPIIAFIPTITLIFSKKRK
jgi:hypothetical protein